MCLQRKRGASAGTHAVTLIVLVNWAVCWFPASPSWAASRFSVLSDSAPTLFFLPGRDSRNVDANIQIRDWKTHTHTHLDVHVCKQGWNPQPWCRRATVRKAAALSAAMRLAPATSNLWFRLLINTPANEERVCLRTRRQLGGVARTRGGNVRFNVKRSEGFS